ncbi:ABC transporter ATP-binding protein [Paenibacillus solisilvae]|uniref:ABC transporter ATP-binding protein n=1 Tax=Paenibacillus solisilvae TaxID=2486751 RepID=A0ABW0W395_9BACL
MLIIKQLVKSYSADQQAITVLDLPHLAIDPKQKVALVGPSGCGKSTLLNIIAGIVRPTSGEVNVLGTDILGLSETKMDTYRARNIGYVFQNFNLLPGFTALENILIAMRFAATIPAGNRKKRAIELLERAGLHHRLHINASRLSQGEQQRVAIARAIANKPSIVLADEPTANLDRHNAAMAVSMLKEMCRTQQTTLIVSTHDMELAGQMDAIVNLREMKPDKPEVVCNVSA